MVCALSSPGPGTGTSLVLVGGMFCYLTASEIDQQNLLRTEQTWYQYYFQSTTRSYAVMIGSTSTSNPAKARENEFGRNKIGVDEGE